jgi:VWFA-related protein
MKALLLCLLLAQGFRTETRVVQVPVTVIDARGRNVDGLRPADFTVLDDGSKRDIALDTFGSGSAPISLVIAIQASGVSKDTLATVRRIGSMIQPLVIGRRGEAAVVAFGTGIAWLRDFTSDSEAIRASIKDIGIGSPLQVRMFDTVVEAAGRMKERPGRHVLMLISEGRDFASEASLSDALEALQREGVEVFAATWSAPARDTAPLTQATGGSSYTFLSERAVQKAVEKLGAEVHSQYILSFPQGDAKLGLHQIEVSVPGHPDFRIRARKAYWAD